MEQNITKHGRQAYYTLNLARPLEWGSVTTVGVSKSSDQTYGCRLLMYTWRVSLTFGHSSPISSPACTSSMASLLLVFLISISSFNVAFCHETPDVLSGSLQQPHHDRAGLRRDLTSLCDADPASCVRNDHQLYKRLPIIDPWHNGTNATRHGSTGVLITNSKTKTPTPKPPPSGVPAARNTASTDSARHDGSRGLPHATNSTLHWIYGTGMTTSSQTSTGGREPASLRPPPFPGTQPRGTGVPLTTGPSSTRSTLSKPLGTGPTNKVPLYTRPASGGPSGAKPNGPGPTGGTLANIRPSGYLRGEHLMTFQHFHN